MRKILYLKIFFIFLCIECNRSCNAGLMRCTGPGAGDCCLTFTATGQCSNDSKCTSSGTNYVATKSNGYTCSKLSFNVNHG